MSYKIRTERTQKPRSGMALGGIGAGWFEIRQDGTTANWNIFNNAPLGHGPLLPILEFVPHSYLFFVAKWQYEGEEPRMKLFQIEESHGAASLVSHEIQYIFPWLTGVDTIEFEATFPFATLKFSADDMPFEAELNAWSPFIPFDEKNSALPGAVFDFKITSKADKKLKITLAACQRNMVAYDRPDRYYTAEAVDGENCRSFMHSVGHVEANHVSFGTMGITSLSADSRCYLGWEHPHPYYERFLGEDLFPEVSDVDGRNKVDKETGKMRINNNRCWSTIAVQRELNSGAGFEHTFIASWNFPNNYARDTTKFTGRDNATFDPSRNEGHYYNNFFSSSAEAGEYIAAHHADLKSRSQAFVDAYYDSDAPDYVLDQVASNLNTMVTSSWFTREGHFGIVEGMAPAASFAGLSTTDVAMYGGVMYAALFPGLSRQVNRDYAGFQNANGSVAHSIRKNFAVMDKSEGTSNRLDLPAQHAFMTLRDAFWCNDRDYLKEMYPSAKAAVEYVLTHRDMNKDGLPDMEGIMCSYDNFPMFGVASFVAGQFIVALKALAEAAELLNEKEDVAKYSALYERGRKRFEDQLWNGEYFRLCKDENRNPPLIDEGCLSDQLISQWAAHQVGFGHLYDECKVKTALKNILKHNYRSWQGLRNCQWPQDKFFHQIDKDIWVDQANTCWTGVELEMASFLIYEGMLDEGLMLIKNVDDRYRKNGMYFDHQEYGGHYFRPMSAWSIINAMAGLGIKHGEYTFAPKLNRADVKLFFAAPDTYGHFIRTSGSVKIKTAGGELKIKKLTVELAAPAASAKVSVPGDVRIEGKILTVDFGKEISAQEIIITLG
ncbi:MAG: hypothetical protein HOO88_03195 [Kiritimatiellaceae bacterium]|nr:hypothetical protein [Kiritimatiellaceae bacterium]